MPRPLLHTGSNNSSSSTALTCAQVIGQEPSKATRYLVTTGLDAAKHILEVGAAVLGHQETH